MASKKMKSFTPCIHIIHFINGYKRTIPNVICVWENEAVHLLTLEGGEWICIVCSRHSDAKGKKQAGIRSRIAEEIEKARKMGLRK